MTCNTCIWQISLSSDYSVHCKKLQNLLDSDKYWLWLNSHRFLILVLMEKACRMWLPSHRTESHREQHQLLGKSILYFNVILPCGGHQSFFMLSFFPLPFSFLSRVLFPTLLFFFPMELLWADFPGMREIHCGKRRYKVAKLAIDFSLEC